MAVTPPPPGRFHIAFDSTTLDHTPAWTRIDNHPNLVTRYQIDRGRQYELDRTDSGRATVEIADKDGLLDPTNPSSPYYPNKIQPMKQAMLCRKNPVDGTWYTRYRGFIDEWDYSFDPSQRVNRLTVSLSDLYEVFSQTQFIPGAFGDEPPIEVLEAYGDQVFYYNARVDYRIGQLICDAFELTPPPPTPPYTWPAKVHAFAVIFSGNVEVRGQIYSPGESVMTAIQEAADAEFPGVANVYVDSHGRLVFHGRLAKFDPTGVASGTTDDRWDYHQFRAGDGAAAESDPPMARIRAFGFNRGASKIINQAQALPAKTYIASPAGGGTDPTTDEVRGQLYEDATSKGLYGIRSWTVQDLQTRNGFLGDPETSSRTGSLEETKKFAKYYVDNFRDPNNRVAEIQFKSIRPGEPGATETWRLLSKADISDRITVTIDSPGGGGFDHVPYFIEGIHETCSPLNPDMDYVEMTLDLSPQALFTYNPWAP